MSPSLKAFLSFAFGGWAGLTAAQYVDLIAGNPLRIRNVVDNGSTLPLLIVGYAFTALLLAVPFALWLALRRTRSSATSGVSSLLPILCGLIYLPALGLAIPYLCQLLGEGQGWRIGSCVGLYLVGMPVVLAEVCLRLARQHRHKTESCETAPMVTPG